MSANNAVKLGRLSTVALVLASILMVIAAVVSAYFGFSLLVQYRATLTYYHIATDYRALYFGLLNFAAFGLDLFAAMLLLLRKHVDVAVILIATVLAFRYWGRRPGEI